LAARKNITPFCPLRANSRKSIQLPRLWHSYGKTKTPALATLNNTITAAVRAVDWFITF
jgi:hypothetical protein